MTPIRPATQSDAVELHALASETFPLACPPGASAESIAEFIAEVLSEERFEDYIADPQRDVLVAGDFDGYVMLVHGEPTDGDVAAALTTRPTVELSKIYVRPGSQGSGVAAALMAATLKAARARGAKAVWLGVNQQNARANAFYEKSGFRQVGIKHFMVGGERHNDFTRELVLIPD